MIMHVFLADESVLLRPVSGQDYYIKALVRTLKELGHKVMFIQPRYLHVLKTRSMLRGDIDIYVHHYYTNTVSDIVARKELPQAAHILYVFQLYDATWTPADRIKYLLYLYINSFIMDKFVVSGRKVYTDVIEVFKFIPQTNIYILRPFYECNVDTLRLAKKKFEEIIENKTLELIYVGRVNKARIDIQAIFTALKRLATKYSKIKFTLISMREMGLRFNGFVKRGNIELEFISRRLSDEEKRMYYERSHIFLYLARRSSAMSPPLAPIEAVCHGTIPILTQHTAQEFEIPHPLIINDNYAADDLVLKIEDVVNSYFEIFEDVYKGFRHFYSKARFLGELLKILNRELN